MATATMRRIPAPGRPTRTTLRGTRTGTSGFAPPVTIYKALPPGTAKALPGDLSIDGQPLSACFGKYISGSGERGVGMVPKAVPAFSVGTKHKHLFDRVVSHDNIWEAYQKASRGKRESMGYLLFRQNEAAHISMIHDALVSGRYQPSEPRRFMVYEPKPREISALPFADRVVQHALCNVLEPIFEAVFLPQSYACRPGRGTHGAAKAVQSMLRKAIAEGGHPWILKTDFSRYFASIQRETLHREVRRKIACFRTLNLLQRFVPLSGVGMPIGNLVSQLSANLYGHIFDRWLVHGVGITSFARYMDDVVVVGHSRESMGLLRAMAGIFASTNMGMRFSKWSVTHWQSGVDFCGYRIWPTHKLLRKSSVVRAKQKLSRMHPGEKRDRFLSAWLGHAKWADSHNLMRHLGVAA